MLDLPCAERVAEEGPEALRARLLPADKALASWPDCHIPEDAAERFCGGQAVPVAENGPEGLVRVYAGEERFLGVGQLGSDRMLAPRRIFRLAG
jgi:tRNA U55 pseudouridine synthase TruB